MLTVTIYNHFNNPVLVLKRSTLSKAMKAAQFYCTRTHLNYYAICEDEEFNRYFWFDKKNGFDFGEPF